MSPFFSSWQFWALMAAVFAAMTAIFAKAGVLEIHPDLATLIRTVVVLVFLGAMVAFSGKAGGLAEVSGRGLFFLVLSGLATGASWLCYFRALSLGKVAQVASVDKLSVILAGVFAFLFLGEKLSGTGWAGLGLITAGVVLVALG